MKNVINYYYNLFPNDIHQKDKKFYFLVDDEEYVLFPNDIDLKRIEYIKSITSLLEKKNIIYNQIVVNKMGDMITDVNHTPHVLIKMNIVDDNFVIPKDLIDFHNLIVGLVSEPFDIKILSKLWMEKVDYFEYQISHFGINYPLIRHSFNYFIGLAENAIMLLNNLLESEISSDICHYRVYSKTKVKDLYNPFNMILDNKVRDMCEYIKDKMFYIDDVDIIKYYFKYNNFEKEEIILFFARILYPTYYFDVCQNIIEGGNESEIRGIIAGVNKYEKNLKNIYRFLKVEYGLFDIEWLNIN